MGIGLVMAPSEIQALDRRRHDHRSCGQIYLADDDLNPTPGSVEASPHKEVGAGNDGPAWLCASPGSRPSGGQGSRGGRLGTRLDDGRLTFCACGGTLAPASEKKWKKTVWDVGIEPREQG